MIDLAQAGQGCSEIRCGARALACPSLLYGIRAFIYDASLLGSFSKDRLFRQIFENLQDMRTSFCVLRTFCATCVLNITSAHSEVSRLA